LLVTSFEQMLHIVGIQAQELDHSANRHFS
jgi:hypothetical protein